MIPVTSNVPPIVVFPLIEVEPPTVSTPGVIREPNEPVAETLLLIFPKWSMVRTELVTAKASA